MVTSLARNVNIYIYFFFVGEKGNEMKSIQALSLKSYSLLPKEGSETDSVRDEVRVSGLKHPQLYN